MRRSGRIGIGALDQVVWSLTNLILVVSVASSSTAPAFGQFAVIYSIVTLGTGLAAALCGEVLAVQAGQSANLPRDTAQALGAGLATASATMVVVAAVAVITNMSAGRTMSWVLGTAIVVAGEGWRSVAIAKRRAADVMVADVGWLVVQSGITASVYWIGAAGEGASLLAWSGGALVCLATLVARLPSHVEFPRDGEVWRRRAHFGFEYLATAVPSQASLWLVAGNLGLAATGMLRALMTAYSPVNTVTRAVSIHLLPDVTERPPQARRLGSQVAIGVIVVVVTATIFLAVLPDAFMRRLFGPSWPLSTSLVIAFGLSRLGVLGTVPAVMILRSWRRDKVTTRLRSATAATTLLAVWLASVLGSIQEVVWSMAVAALLSAALWWLVVETTTPRTTQPNGREGQHLGDL